MYAFFNRYKELIIIATLLLAPMVSYLSRGHRGRSPNFVDRAVLRLSTPVQSVLTWAFTGVVGAVDGYVALRGAHEEAQACRAELSQARAEVNALREADQENRRLKKLLAYSEETLQQEIAARVVGLGPTRQVLSVRINRGESDGVRRGMPVLTPEGVVGQIMSVVGGTADVMLVNDPASRVGVVVQRSRVRGTVSGLGPEQGLSLENVLRQDDVQEGDAVVTSGTDGIFPAGLVVGTVRGLTRPPAQMFLQARVQPAVDLRRFEEVLVLPTLPGVLPSAVAPGKGTP